MSAASVKFELPQEFPFDVIDNGLSLREIAANLAIDPGIRPSFKEAQRPNFTLVRQGKLDQKVHFRGNGTETEPMKVFTENDTKLSDEELIQLMAYIATEKISHLKVVYFELVSLNKIFKLDKTTQTYEIVDSAKEA